MLPFRHFFTIVQSGRSFKINPSSVTCARWIDGGLALYSIGWSCCPYSWKVDFPTVECVPIQILNPGPLDFAKRHMMLCLKVEILCSNSIKRHDNHKGLGGREAWHVILPFKRFGVRIPTGALVLLDFQKHYTHIERDPNQIKFYKKINNLLLKKNIRTQYLVYLRIK